MKARAMKQYGWITGPVECLCTGCDWHRTFVAEDSSTPANIAEEFALHECDGNIQFGTYLSKLRHSTPNHGLVFEPRSSQL
jgi:hypothetical protein